MIQAIRYSGVHREKWDQFVAGSKNGAFLFLRGYQDYHAGRFPDHSYLFVKGGRVAALLPASNSGDQLTSHGGLTFGGVISDHRMTQPLMLEVFEVLMSRLREDGIRRLVYKASPSFYHRFPSDEDGYALFRFGASLVRRDLNSVVCPQCRPQFQERRQRGLKKALRAGLEVRETEDYPAFWRILTDVLESRHGKMPVHTLEEIQMLRRTFPQHIRLFAVYGSGELLAGAVIYENAGVAHAQYIGSSPAGMEAGALDLLFSELITSVYLHKKWFSFGVSTESGGTCLNEGLVAFKEGFGARSVVQDFYEIHIQ